MQGNLTSLCVVVEQACDWQVDKVGLFSLKTAVKAMSIEFNSSNIVEVSQHVFQKHCDMYKMSAEFCCAAGRQLSSAAKEVSIFRYLFKLPRYLLKASCKD